MSKEKDPLFDDLIEALEAMSGEVAGDEDGEKPSDAKVAGSPPAAAARAAFSVKKTQAWTKMQWAKMQLAVPARAAAAQQFNRASAASRAGLQSLTRRAIQASNAVRSRLLSQADVRMVVRMSVLLVLAGAVTLFFITRPYTSGRADARNGPDPSSLIAKTHTELERVTIRGIHETSIDEQSRTGVHLPPIEPARFDVEALPASDAHKESRRVRTEDIRIEQPELLAGLAAAQEPVQTAPGLGLKSEATPPARLTQPSPDADAAYNLGLNLLKHKDIAAARLMLKRAADRGHGPAALALAETHDVSRNATSAEAGIHMDDAVARKYYAVARDLGVADAAERLSSLGQQGQ